MRPSLTCGACECSAGDAKLFALGTDGALKQLSRVEYTGEVDMPSQGALSVESDRAEIRALEQRLTAAFGHAAIQKAFEGAPPRIDISGKLLRDEHMATLRQLIESGCAAGATELNLSWNGALTRLPNMPRKSMPCLVSLKLAGCDQLRALPKVGEGVVVTKPVHLAEGDFHRPSISVDW